VPGTTWYLLDRRNELNAAIKNLRSWGSTGLGGRVKKELKALVEGLMLQLVPMAVVDIELQVGFKTAS